MSAWWRARALWLLAYGLIVALVVGGLGWVTRAALGVEKSDRTRLALWRLENRVGPALAREDSRPYQHYDPLYVPVPALQRNGFACTPGTVLVPSPLLNAELPDWMVLHFQATPKGNWRSPQVLSPKLLAQLQSPGALCACGNVTPPHAERLAALANYPPRALFDRLRDDETTELPTPKDAVQFAEVPNAPPAQVVQPQQSGQLFNQNPDNDFQNRARQNVAIKGEGRGGFSNNAINYNFLPFGEEIAWLETGGKWTADAGKPCPVRLGLLQPMWLRDAGRPDQLVVARLALCGDRRIVQGIVIDWPKLRGLLLAELPDLFPDADLVAFDGGDRDEVMTALPVRLVPGAMPWERTPLRVGLAVAWLAAVAALVVVGLGGWGLLDLSERRFRFVSAVTHELRTPLTTLRLYLDMLTSGMVRDEATRGEYLHTLHGESDRLQRLVTNVLDFARLERQRPQLSLASVNVVELLEKVRDDWRERCKGADKELVLEIADGCCPAVTTDRELVERIVGNLIDNACKYSRGSADARVWLRAAREPGRLVLEVEDRGPGVAGRERRGIFRPFRRGQGADTTAGGVGLGLALACRWARLLGGRLDLRPGAGACFRLSLPG